ncbi:FAD-binding protein [Eggerthella sp. HF-4214]|uniref:Urocanate reductase n=2 Tax=Eggerthella guodeyinii TaxID=2690837 RepID=A0A6N7RMX0_9ACTN|nr:FAD-binding protein [Eggerthella guodeyinii]
MSDGKNSAVSRRDALKFGALAALGASSMAALGGCAPQSTSARPAAGEGSHMAPGTYVGKALGHKGLFELPVTVTVNETSILDIDVPESRFEHGETTPILMSVRDRLFPRIIAAQSLDVDAITGATSSSMTSKSAIEDALKQAYAAAGFDEGSVEAFHMPVERSEEGVVEEIDTDLLVVGLSVGGCFALKAATERMQALNGGGRVSIMAIDRAGKVGGRSCLTHMIQSVNPKEPMGAFNDGQPFLDPEEYFNLWTDWVSDEDGNPLADLDVIRMFIDNSGDTLDWQLANGWRVGGADPEGCQNGTVSFHTVPAPMHQPGTFEDRRVIVDGFLKQFVAGAQAQGARVELETEGYEILYDESTSAVTGVKARNVATGKEYVINAKAVVMGTGGFGANGDMLSKLLPAPYAGAYPFLGTGTDTGLMVQSAIDLGAGTRNIDMSPIVMHIGLPHFLKKFPINVDESSLNNFTGRYSTWTINDAPLGLGLSGNQLAVGPDGKRFADENQLMQLFSAGIHVSSWPSYKCGHYFYSLWSKKALDEVAREGLNKVGRWEVYQCQGGVPREMPVPEIYDALDACVEEGMAWKADTIADLAVQMGVDPDALKGTVDEYNQLCEKGADDAFGKDPALLDAVEEGPFYAIKLMNVIFATCGGLTVDAKVRVCRTDGTTPIDGLYAFGCDSLGNLLNPRQNYTVFPAIAAGWNQTGGRMAALNAVDYVADAYGLAEVSTQTLPEGMEPPDTDKPMW